MSRQQSLTLARTFKGYLDMCQEANWIVRQPVHQATSRNPTVTSSPTIKDKMNTSSTLPNIPAKSPATEQHLTQDLSQVVGKGSNFHRKNVQQYLKPLGFPQLRRAQTHIKEPYPESEARQKRLVNKSLENSKNQSTIVHHLNNTLIQEIIELLVDITPKPPSRNHPSPIAVKDSNYHHIGLKRHVYHEVPQIPEFANSSLIFERYIYTLTHSNFHFKNSSKFDGVISKLLRNLFHPLNTNTLHLRAPNSFNYLIHFFGHKSDIATCRELLVQMRIENVTPNITTYNLMLRNLSYVQKIQHMSDPYKVALKLLKQMKSTGLKADLVTWNTMFSILTDEKSKILLIEKRAKLQVPVDVHFGQSILQYLIETRNPNTMQLLMYAKDLQMPLNPRSERTFIHLMIKEKQFDSVYKLMETLKNDKGGLFKPDVADLNAFLIGFSEIKRVDLAQGIIQTFKKQFGVQPNFESYNLLMKTLAVSGHWKEKYQVLRVLYHQMLTDLDGIIAGEYWLRRLRSRLKFVYQIDVQLSPNLDEKELQVRQMVEAFEFQEGKIPLWITKKTPAEKKKYAQLLGYYQSRFTEPLKTESESMKLAKKNAADYRERISKISISTAMKKRAMYVEDQFTGLKQELILRRIIE